MKNFLIPMLLVTLGLHTINAEAQDSAGTKQTNEPSIRALLIVAHPDDEYEMAGAIYRITSELSGTVDQIIVTDGEAGYRYSYLAARYYGTNLTDESTGRAKLPHIREEEAHRAARILGIRHQWFLNERDDHFTLNADEVLKGWRTQRVLGEIKERLRKGHYDVVFVLLPSEDTHGGHKAATILALEVVQRMAADERPAVVAADAASSESEDYQPLAGYPLTQTTTSEPEFHFDRDIHFGFNNSLSYAIVVDWVIAEHKSQGLFQTKSGQDRFENFWLFAASGDSAAARTGAIFARISQNDAQNKQSAIAPAPAAQ
jgi:LmbE family N-acetylglucosaminyl deacetylase